MSDHYFTPHLEFASSTDPSWIRAAIHGWERGDEPAIVGTNGQPLPAFPELVGGLIEHRWGRFAADPNVQYRLRLEVTGRERRKVRIGLLFSGPGLPGELTRGGGELIRRLSANWRHQPQEASFPTRLRELSSPAGVSEFITRLLNPSRRMPIVAVTCRAGSDEVVTDAGRLLDYVEGMAEVWSLPRTSVTRELAQAFTSRGFDARWNCYDGGVRLYLPGFNPAVDTLGHHPLVLASRLLGAGDPTEAAASWVLGAVSRALGVDAWREAWREELAARHGAVEFEPILGNPALATLGDLPAMRRVEPATEQAQELPRSQPPADEVTIAELPPDETTTAKPGPSPPEPEPPPALPSTVSEARPSRFQRARASLTEAFEVFVDLEQLVQEFQEELETVRQDRDALARERDELSQELQDLHERGREHAVPQSLPELLALYVELSDGSLRVTDYACRKAADSRYANLGLVGRVLATFIAVGPDFGAVDAALQRQLGKRVRGRPRESPPTMAKFGKHREFRLDDGQMVTVEQHLTLGHGSRNANETLQIYWRRASDGAAEIVYVGVHLHTVAENT